MSIVVLGAVFVDVKGYPTATYIPGGRNTGNVEQVHGGVSRNIVEDIANLELRPRFVSLVDHSALGTEVIEKLKNHKVDTRFMRRTDDGLGTWLAIFDNDGDVVAAISKRPDLTPVADILDEKGDEIFRDADSALLEIDMDTDIVKRVMKYAEKYHFPVYAAISNMSIAAKRRDLLQSVDCVVCNKQEAGILFSEDYDDKTADEMQQIIAEKIKLARIPCMVVTMGVDGSVYADLQGNMGFCPAKRVAVKDTTGAGDAFFAGCAAGLTYHKSLAESCEIGTRMAASVITSLENVIPRFLPEEFGLPGKSKDERNE